MIPSALALACASVLLAWQPEAAAQSGGRATALEETIVSAQRREERLLDAPLSVFALSSEDLEERRIFGIRDLQQGAIPALQVLPLTGRASAVQISMRGITSGDPTQISQDPAIGIYIDGVYLGRVQGLGMDLGEIERMEVLRGPQGTLFGRNATGGALNIVTRKPSGELGMRQRIGVGNYGARELQTSVDLPEFANVSVKLDGIYRLREGWVDNFFENSDENFDYNYQQRQGVRLTALWEPNDSFSAQYSYESSRDRSTSAYPHINSLIDDREQSPLIGVEDGRVSRARIGSPLRPSVGAVEGHTLSLAYDINENLTFKSISAYRELDQSQKDQWAGSFFGINFQRVGLTGRYSLAGVEQDQFSQEFQLIGSTERLQYVVGAFYFEESGDDFAADGITQRFADGGTRVVTLNPRIIVPTRSSTVDVESRAVFAQATWTPPVLDDRLDLTFGLRYTDDKKSGELTSIRGVPPNPALTFRFSSDRWDPAATIAYRFSDDANVYLRWSNAYRAGGANSRSTRYNAFAEEEVEAWEVGFKAEFWERRARVGLAAFQMNYDDRQFLFSSPENPSITETVNTPETVKVRGVEADLQLIASEGLSLTFNYAWTDPDLPILTNPFPPNPQVFPDGGGQTPKHAASAALAYDFQPMPFGNLRLHLDSTYNSGYFTSSFKTDSFVLINGRLTLSDLPFKFGGSRAEISLWATNLFDKEYTFFKFPLDAPGFVGSNIDFFGPPRMFGAELMMHF